MGVLLAVLATLAAVGLVAIGAMHLVHRRRLAARVAAVASRLESSVLLGSVASPAGLSSQLARLELTADQVGEALTAAADRGERLRAAVDAIPQGVIVVDGDGEVLVCNDAASVLTEARHADALVAAAVDELSTAAVAGKGDTRTLELFGPPRRTVVVAAVPLHSAGGDGAVTIVDDVTERRRLEAMRRDFVANISHELKTPVGALGLLAETLADEEDPTVRQRLAERIQKEAFRVGRTIEDLLELSRIESGALPLREPVAIHLVLAEAVERIRPAAEQAGVAVEVQDPPGRLAVLGDRRQLVSALCNLLDNAVKYSERGEQVELSVATAGSEVAIVVTDHGIGIPARDLERVFERFYRVDQARSRQTGGTGLGLAIVRHVASNHGGEVLVDSRLGEGSTFRLVLQQTSDSLAVTSREQK